MFFPSKVLILNQTYPIEAFFTLPAIDIQPQFFRRLVFIGFWAQFGLLPSELDASVSHQILPTLEVALSLPDDFHNPEAQNFATGSITINVLDTALFLQSLTTSHPALAPSLQSNMGIDPPYQPTGGLNANSNSANPLNPASLTDDVHVFLRFDGYIFQLLSYHDYRCKTIKLYNRQAEVLETYQLDLHPTFEMDRKEYYQTTLGPSNHHIDWTPVDISQGSPPTASPTDTTLSILSNEKLILTKPHIVPGHLPSRLSQFPGSTQWVRDSGLSRQCLPWYGGCVHLFPVELLGQLIVNRKSRTFRLRTPDDAKLDPLPANSDHYALDGESQGLHQVDGVNGPGNDSGDENGAGGGSLSGRNRSARLHNAKLAATHHHHPSTSTTTPATTGKELAPPTPTKQQRRVKNGDGGISAPGPRGAGKRGKEAKGDKMGLNQHQNNDNDRNQYDDEYGPYGRNRGNGGNGNQGGMGSASWLPGTSRGSNNPNPLTSPTGFMSHSNGNNDDNQSDSDSNELYMKKPMKRGYNASILQEFEQNDFLYREKRVESVQAVKIPPSSRPYVEAMDVTLTNHITTQNGTIKQLVQQNQVMLESVSEIVQFSHVMQIQLRQMMSMMMNQQSEYLNSVGKFESLIDGLLDHVSLISTNDGTGAMAQDGTTGSHPMIDSRHNAHRMNSITHPTHLSPLQSFFNIHRQSQAGGQGSTSSQTGSNQVHSDLSPYAIHQFSHLPSLSSLTPQHQPKTKDGQEDRKDDGVEPSEKPQESEPHTTTTTTQPAHIGAIFPKITPSIPQQSEIIKSGLLYVDTDEL